ncbi:MAG: hypothetical protein KKA42_06780 [candidate division Zixibacteria bacterium]|nr:hypothetical protein [candidate division Zixibacteria bacterium]
MRDDLRELLYRSFDGDLTPDERRQLDDALARDGELRSERDRVARMRKSLADGAEGFRPFFAERVMHRLKGDTETNPGLEQIFEWLQLVVRRVAITGAVALVALVAYNLSTSDELSLAAAIGAPTETIESVLESPFEPVLEQFS